MRILHISDFHLRPTNFDQEIVRKSFLEHVETERANLQKPDLVVFSGDLVQSGTENSTFRTASERVLVPLMKEFGLGPERLIVCPGNHDIDREKVRAEGYIEKGLIESLRTRSEINAFLDQHWTKALRPNQLAAPVGRLASFYQTIWKQGVPHSVFSNPFLMVRSLQLGGQKVGIAILNTAWRCTGEPDNADRGHLILGERVVDHALALLADHELKIAVLHHPLDWLVDDDRAAVEPRLHAGFDLLLFGHMHRASPETRTNAFGGLVYSQAGALYESRDYYVGYSRLHVDQPRAKVDIDLFRYDDRSRKFAPDIGLVPTGRLTFPLTKAGVTPGLGALLARIAPVVRKLANDHLNIASDDQQGMDIETDFVCPPLVEASATAAFLGSSTPSAPTDLQSLLSDNTNIIIGGSAECGKTTIAHAVALKVARGAGDTLRIPLIANFNQLAPRRASIERITRHYANEVSGSSIGAEELSGSPLFIFVDGVDMADEARMIQLKELISSSPNARWMLLATMRPGETLKTYTKQYSLIGMHALIVSALPRTSIRLLSAHWMKQATDGPTTDSMFQNVMEHIRRTGLPRTGYVVSLMLWTLRNTSSGELLNEAVLLGNILDYLLNRMDYRGSLRSEFDFQSKSIVLQHLAYWMKNSDSFHNKNDVVAELIRYLGLKGLRYDAAAIVEGFIKCGVFAQLDEQVGFRYQRFQEYFVAGHLRDDREAYKLSLTDDNWRFYRRELDIYTSRFRNETELLDVARGIIDKIVRPQSEMRGDALEQYMQEGSNALVAMRRLEEMRSKPLTAVQIDLVKDRAEARWRDRQDRRLELASPDQIARNDFPVVKFGDALELYSQFIRNLEFADREEKRRHLAACMEFWVEVMTGVYNGLKVLFAELRSDFNGAVADQSKATKQLHQMVDDFEIQARCLIPSIISRSAHHNLGSEKLFDFIDEIAADGKGDKFARLAAVSILLELDPSRAMDRLESGSWESMLSLRWVCEILEARLYRYYLDRPMTADVNAKFVAFIAELEVTISGNAKARGSYMQALTKKGLQRRALDPSDEEPLSE